MQIERNATVTEIRCPISECKKEWECELCLIVANMDQSEKLKLWIRHKQSKQIT